MQDTQLTVNDLNDWYSWDAHNVYDIDSLVENINNEEWYKILKKHIKAGNSKIAKNTWIFSISPATDCPHLGEPECQVPKDMCYAYQSEKQYTHPIHRKRRLTVIWDVLDAETFAETLLSIRERKTSETDIEFFRLNEAGDFRDESDVLKFNHIARILSDKADIQSYVYSASSHVDWTVMENRNFTLNASNEQVNVHADRRFSAKPIDEIDPQEGEHVCPAELHGRDTVKCGECRMCTNDQAGDVFVPLH